MKTKLDELSQDQQSYIKKHLRFVLDYNKKVNLTNIISYEEGLLLHIEDSLLGLDEVNLAPEGPLADLGSGAGYPGIPLAIATGRNTVLIESVAKKAQALKLFIAQEGLDNSVQIATKRSEDLAREVGAAFSVVTARAVGELPELIELASPLLSMGGLLICYKAKPSEEELERGRLAAIRCGLIEESLRRCILSDGKTARTLVAYKKVDKPTIDLPRRNGMAKKRPLA